MADNKSNTTPEMQEIKLEPNEIMRFCIFKREDGSFAISFYSDGPQQPMMDALMKIVEHLDLICVPKLLPILRDETEEEPKATSTPQTD